MCKTPSNIFGDTDCEEGDRYTLLIYQAAKLKEENELLDIKEGLNGVVAFTVIG